MVSKQQFPYFNGFFRPSEWAEGAVEVEGGTWINGRHNRGKGFAEDCEKYNQAALLGWRVFRLTIDMLENDPYGHLMPIILFIRDRQANEQDDYEIIDLD